LQEGVGVGGKKSSSTADISQKFIGIDKGRGVLQEGIRVDRWQKQQQQVTFLQYSLWAVDANMGAPSFDQPLELDFHKAWHCS
jgi:hypothetical protein